MHLKVFPQNISAIILLSHLTHIQHTSSPCKHRYTEGANSKHIIIKRLRRKKIHKNKNKNTCTNIVADKNHQNTLNCNKTNQIKYFYRSWLPSP